jgi:hypothetical protein
MKVWTNATYIRNNPWMAGARIGFWPGMIGFDWQFATMAMLQAFFGLLFMGLAVAALRPLRGSSWPGARPQTGWWTRIHARYRQFVEARATAALTRNELLASRTTRPPCGDDPVAWKERYTRMGGGLKWLGSRPVALFFIVLLGCYLFDVAFPVFRGFTLDWWRVHTWQQINSALRSSSAVLAALVMLPVSAAAAASITSEREQDTWTSLATTLLTPREVIRGKQRGAVWSARWLGIGLFSMLGAGLLLGAFHPIGLFAALTVLAASVWLTSAIGVLVSSLARNSTLAAFFTFFAMSIFIWASAWPYVFWQVLASYADIRFMLSGSVPLGQAHSNFVTPPFAGAAVIALVNSILASLFTLWSMTRLAATWGRG